MVEGWRCMLILGNRGFECRRRGYDGVKGSMAFLQNKIRCPPMLGARRT